MLKIDVNGKTGNDVLEQVIAYLDKATTGGELDPGQQPYDAAAMRAVFMLDHDDINVKANRYSDILLTMHTLLAVNPELAKESFDFVQGVRERLLASGTLVTGDSEPEAPQTFEHKDTGAGLSVSTRVVAANIINTTPDVLKTIAEMQVEQAPGAEEKVAAGDLVAYLTKNGNDGMKERYFILHNFMVSAGINLPKFGLALISDLLQGKRSARLAKEDIEAKLGEEILEAGA